MRVEEYFDFHSDQDIRLKGTRVGIETVLLDYLDAKSTPEQIVAAYPSVTLEQVYATILYYLHNRDRMDGYLEGFLNDSRRRQEMQDRISSPIAERLKGLRRGTAA